MTRTADVNLAFVDGFEGASFQVQHAARTGQEIRIGLLVQRMRRRRRFGKLTLWIERFQRKAVVVDNPHSAIGSGARRGGYGRALENFAAVQGQTFIKALHDRQRREAGRIVRPPAQHYLGAGLQRPLEGFDPHLGDDIGALFNGLMSQLRHKIQGSDFAVIQRLMNDRFIDIRRNQRQGE